ncbi:hypothetical protein ACLIBH_04910 [Virgibacillus sp. W0430]|uniref:hypothetical protein n=1 Tax=Virgibacillus sp. W0430 TaxID=3391580 RepID=UPI003F48B9DC
MNEIRLDNIELEINNAVEQFNKDVKAIKKSDNPKYKDRDVRDYELKALRKNLDKEVGALKKEYEQVSDNLIADASQKAARSSFASPANTAAIDTILDDFTADISLAYSDADKQQAREKLTNAIVNMTANEMAHVRRKLPSIVAQVSDEATLKELRHINSVLAEELKTPEQLELERLKDKTSAGGAISYNHLRLTHQLYADHQVSARSNLAGL